MSEFEKSLKEKSHEMSIVFRDRTTLAPNPELALKLEEIGRWAREWCLKHNNKVIKKVMGELKTLQVQYDRNFKIELGVRSDNAKLRTSNQRLREALEKLMDEIKQERIHHGVTSEPTSGMLIAEKALKETGGDDV